MALRASRGRSDCVRRDDRLQPQRGRGSARSWHARARWEPGPVFVPAPPQLAGPAPPWAEGAVRVGGGIRPPTKTKHVAPVYPPDAKEAGVTGVVILEARIEADGRVINARVLRSIRNWIRRRSMRSSSGSSRRRCQWRSDSRRDDSDDSVFTGRNSAIAAEADPRICRRTPSGWRRRSSESSYSAAGSCRYRGFRPFSCVCVDTATAMPIPAV